MPKLMPHANANQELSVFFNVALLVEFVFRACPNWTAENSSKNNERLDWHNWYHVRISANSRRTIRVFVSKQHNCKGSWVGLQTARLSFCPNQIASNPASESMDNWNPNWWSRCGDIEHVIVDMKVGAKGIVQKHPHSEGISNPTHSATLPYDNAGTCSRRIARAFVSKWHNRKRNWVEFHVKWHILNKSNSRWFQHPNQCPIGVE